MPLVEEKEIGICVGVVVSEAAAAALKIPRVGNTCRGRATMRCSDGRWRCERCYDLFEELRDAEEMT